MTIMVGNPIRHRYTFVARTPWKVRNFAFMDDGTQAQAAEKAKRILRSADFMLVGDEVRD